jgi:hypothetical protein
VNGWICRDVADMAARVAALDLSPVACRTSVARRFSVDRMAGDYLRLYERARHDAAAFSVAELEA